jgi:hypothetical protein
MTQPELKNELKLPGFSPSGLVRETTNFIVMMDWKPGLEGQTNGGRFFIEPKTDEAQKMLSMAAKEHNIDNFNERGVPNPDGEIMMRQCLRADFIVENLPSLMLGVVEIPNEGEDSIPSPDRMEECLRLNPSMYTFGDLLTQSY